MGSMWGSGIYNSFCATLSAASQLPCRVYAAPNPCALTVSLSLRLDISANVPKTNVQATLVPRRCLSPPPITRVTGSPIGSCCHAQQQSETCGSR